MAVPKKRTSKSKKNMRYSKWLTKSNRIFKNSFLFSCSNNIKTLKK